MNISVYLPTNLRDRIDAYVRSKSITKNAAVRNAIALPAGKGGKPIGAYDILIGATALARGFTRVTSNEKEFSRIPSIEIEN